MNLYSRKDSSGGDSTIEMMANVQHNHNQYHDQYHDQYHHNGAQQEEDTHKEVYASPYNHYLGSPNNEPRPPVPENYPELAPHSGLEAVKPDDPNKYGGAGGVFVQKYHDDSPIPVTATPASDKLLPPPPPSSDRKPWYQNWTIRILIIALTVIIVVAIIVGAVVGTQAGKDDSSNDSPSETETTSGTRTTTTSTPTSTSSPDELKMGVTYNATFTMYGTNDGSGGTNCNVKQTSCAFYSDPGYAVGVSTNLFSVSGGSGLPPVCGTCWLLETFKDSGGTTFRRNITAIVNEECGGEPGEVCGMETLEDQNPWDGNVNFNLCTDSGARDALFDKGSDRGLAMGRVTRVSCDEWDGEIID